MQARAVHESTFTRWVVVLALVVPLAAWLAVVWQTRPYSPDEIRADLDRVEALPAYERDVEDCRATFGDVLGTGCDELAFAEHTAVTRDGLVLHPEASVWATLGLAALALVVGARWPAGTGVRGLLKEAGRLFALTFVTALVIGLTWWWGLEWVAEHRRLEYAEGPHGATLSAALAVGLSGVVGLACAQLRRGVVRIVALSAVAVSLGLVLLLARPVAPWLPPLNVEALLLGEATYDIPDDQVVCPPTTVAYAVDYCPSDHRTRTGGAGAAYLVGTTLVLLSASALTRTPRRRRTVSFGG